MLHGCISTVLTCTDSPFVSTAMCDEFVRTYVNVSCGINRGHFEKGGAKNSEAKKCQTEDIRRLYMRFR